MLTLDLHILKSCTLLQKHPPSLEIFFRWENQTVVVLFTEQYPEAPSDFRVQDFDSLVFYYMKIQKGMHSLLFSCTCLGIQTCKDTCWHSFLCISRLIRNIHDDPCNTPHSIIVPDNYNKFTDTPLSPYPELPGLLIFNIDWRLSCSVFPKHVAVPWYKPQNRIGQSFSPSGLRAQGLLLPTS